MNLDRRTMLRLLGGGIAMTTMGCASVGQHSPACQKADNAVSNLVIDVHCHVFNGRDLPISGFTERVLVDSDERRLRAVLVPLVLFAARVIHEIAPDYNEESWELEKLLDLRGEERRNRIRAARAASIENFKTASTELVERLPLAGGLARQLKRYFLDPDSGEPAGPLSRYVRWVYLLSRYRFLNADELLSTYPDVRLFTPALVDMDRWVDTTAAVPLSRQVRLMEKISLLFPGRLHGFVGYDPWRQIEAEADSESPLQIAIDAITKRGFVGVKLYPPMGFGPTGNVRAAHFPRRSRYITGFEAKLDAAMRKLFAWCTENDVPVLAHGNRSNYTIRKYHDAEIGGPKQWEEALRDFPDLRLNFGHFGGFDSFEHEKEGWSWGIAALMDKYEYVYADTSHFDAISSLHARKNLCAHLTRMFEKYPKAADRILYGSDWLMLAMSTGYREFFTNIRAATPPAASMSILGANAMKYLGLKGRTRDRLSAFYLGHGHESPDWLDSPTDGNAHLTY